MEEIHELFALPLAEFTAARNELARRLNLRKTPELHFEPDPWPGGEDRLETLLKRAKKMRGSAEKQP